MRKRHFFFLLFSEKLFLIFVHLEKIRIAKKCCQGVCFYNAWVNDSPLLIQPELRLWTLGVLWWTYNSKSLHIDCVFRLKTTIQISNPENFDKGGVNSCVQWGKTGYYYYHIPLSEPAKYNLLSLEIFTLQTAMHSLFTCNSVKEGMDSSYFHNFTVPVEQPDIQCVLAEKK